jgi:hypothetical protein
MNRFLKLSRFFSHSGVLHSTYADLEFYVEILCGLANMPCAPSPSAQPAATEISIFDALSTQRYKYRLNFFHSLYCPTHSSLNLLQLNPVPSELTTSADHSQSQMWHAILSALPTGAATVFSAFRARAEHLLHAAQRPEYHAKSLNYAHATWTHPYPDHRAQALYDSHYVLLLEFCKHAQPNGLFGYYIQGTVHPSQRSIRRHFPRISFNSTPPPSPFALSSQQCSCEDGCAQRTHVRTTDPWRSTDGLCSHVQALLLTLLDTKKHQRPVVRLSRMSASADTRSLRRCG